MKPWVEKSIAAPTYLFALEDKRADRKGTSAI
jgi:hypothetical protein